MKHVGKPTGRFLIQYPLVDVKIRFFVVKQTLKWVYQFPAFLCKKQEFRFLTSESSVELFGEILRYSRKSKRDFQEAVTKIFVSKKFNILIFLKVLIKCCLHTNFEHLYYSFSYSNFVSKMRYLDFESTVTRLYLNQNRRSFF